MLLFRPEVLATMKSKICSGIPVKTFLRVTVRSAGLLDCKVVV